MSEAFENDNFARKAWVDILDPAVKEKLLVIEKVHRLELYREIDAKVKAKSIEILRKENEKTTMVKLKGLGYVRQAKNQIGKMFAFDEAAKLVTSEMFNEWNQPNAV